jgi:hypothetical protein
MTQAKLWFKKRTTRGTGRKVHGKTSLSAKNLSREIYKNQRWYSHFLLKFLICGLLGLVWLRVGLSINLLGHQISIFPIGVLIGIILLALERVPAYRAVGLIILLFTATSSFIWPIGLVL